MHQLRQVAYVSRVSPMMSPAAERQLMGVANRNNRRSGLTGVLVTSGAHYLQVLEGPCAALDTLLPKVSADHRHYAIRVLFDRPITFRAYSNWSMGYVYSLDLAEELAALHAAGVVDDIASLLARFQPDDLGESVFGRDSAFGLPTPVTKST